MIDIYLSFRYLATLFLRSLLSWPCSPNSRLLVIGGYMNKSSIKIVNTSLEHAYIIPDLLRAAYENTLDESGYMSSSDILQQLQSFPEGQFVALDDQRVTGMISFMRTNYSPFYPPLPWLAMIGGTSLSNHEPDGKWLYGVELAVHPLCQKQGIGTRLLKTYFAICETYQLAGFYCGAILSGYFRYQNTLSSREYAERVLQGELHDPNVALHQRIGLEIGPIIEPYSLNPLSGGCAIMTFYKTP
jgi:GNAT superfamily N-acetyltransferase